MIALHVAKNANVFVDVEYAIFAGHNVDDLDSASRPRLFGNFILEPEARVVLIAEFFVVKVGIQTRVRILDDLFCLLPVIFKFILHLDDVVPGLSPLRRDYRPVLVGV